MPLASIVPTPVFEEVQTVEPAVLVDPSALTMFAVSCFFVRALIVCALFNPLTDSDAGVGAVTVTFKEPETPLKNSLAVTTTVPCVEACRVGLEATRPILPIEVGEAVQVTLVIGLPAPEMAV